MCHIVVFIIDITAIIWQQILYHTVVLIFLDEYKCVKKIVNSEIYFFNFFCLVSKKSRSYIKIWQEYKWGKEKTSRQIVLII